MRIIQKHLVEKGTLPVEILTEVEAEPISNAQLDEAIRKVHQGTEQLEVILAEPLRAVPRLHKALLGTKDEKERIHLATILCGLKNKQHWSLVANYLLSLTAWDKGWDYRGMHQWGMSNSPIDALIICLGNSGEPKCLNAIHKFGQLLQPEDYFSHYYAISLACESIGSKLSVDLLYELLQKRDIRGWAIANLKEAKKRLTLNTIDGVYVLEDTIRNSALKELHLARALYRCGDKEGLGESVLKEYAQGMEGHYAIHAQSLLNEKTK